MIKHFMHTTAVAILVLFSSLSWSQTAHRTVTGRITCHDEATPLEGVTVLAKGSNKVSGSQPDGIYYINVQSQDSVLVFSMPDFKTEEVRLNTSNEYDIALLKLENGDDRNFASLAGKWRGSFITKQNTEIPFIFEVAGANIENAKVFFINAEERFEAGPLKLAGDSLYIAIDQFDNELAFKIDSGALKGFLRRQDRKSEPIPVSAVRGVDYRFKTNGTKPAGDISGTYDITFKSENGKDEKAVGLFKQDGNKLKATFLRITGDSRYLDGIVEGNNFYLSSFIGGGPSLYSGSFTAGGQLTGNVTGLRGGQAFTGIANENAALPDAYKLTYLKDGYTSLDFSFPNLEGKKISLKDEKYRNKVVILTITGTWCPNCIDEATFLSAWYKKNKNRGVEALALHYERQTDSAFVHKVMTRFKKRFDIQYDEVIAGTADKQVVAESLPALNSFLSFPTIIFIDKKGNVAKIYTGYNGPATGKYYDQFVADFNKEVDTLLKAK